MAADAYIVTFAHCGDRYNVRVYPTEDSATAEVNVDAGDGWLPLTMVDPDATTLVEVQGRLV